MALPDNLFMIAFRQQRLGLMLAAIMTILVYFATMAAMGETFLANAVMVWSHGQQGRLTVEIPPPDRPEISQTDRVNKIIMQLEDMPEIAQTQLITEAETTRLLEPWLKDTALAQSLPLPTLIDVHVKADRSINLEALRAKLAAQVPDTMVDDPASWLTELLTLTQSLGLVAGVMLGLTGFMLIIAIGLICRAAMAVQHDTIELLHLLGATDNEIARQFQRHTRRLSGPAALAGFTLAALTFAVIILVFKHFMTRALMFNATYFTWSVIIFLVPVLAIGCATLTARLAVLKRLRQIL